MQHLDEAMEKRNRLSLTFSVKVIGMTIALANFWRSMSS